MARLDLARIRDLIKVAVESDAVEVEIEEKGVRILVRQEATTVTLQTPYMMPFPPLTGATPGYMPQVVPSPVGVAESAAAVPDAPPAEEAAEPEGTVIRAPIVGTFFRAPAPDADPFVEVGSTIAVGDTLCIIEAMKNLNEIESEVAGIVKEILVQDAEPVSYDQSLFVIV